jgi:hypothetical protein
MSCTKLRQACQSLDSIYATLEFRVITFGFRAQKCDLFAGTVPFHIRFDSNVLRAFAATTLVLFLLDPFHTTLINSQLRYHQAEQSDGMRLATKSTELIK